MSLFKKKPSSPSYKKLLLRASGLCWALPAGCLQYHCDTTAYIQSFSWDGSDDATTTPSSNHQNNQNYNVCFRRHVTFKMLFRQWKQSDDRRATAALSTSPLSLASKLEAQAPQQTRWSPCTATWRATRTSSPFLASSPPQPITSARSTDISGGGCDCLCSDAQHLWLTQQYKESPHIMTLGILAFSTTFSSPTDRIHHDRRRPDLWSGVEQLPQPCCQRSQDSQWVWSKLVNFHRIPLFAGFVKPFTVGVNFDASDELGTKEGTSGFSILYTQKACA